MINGYNIIQLEQKDAVILAVLEAKSFQKAWKEEDFIKALTSDNYLVYGIKDEFRLLSYIIIRSIPAFSAISKENKGEFEILNIATDKEHRKKGYAQALLRHIINIASTKYAEIVFLEVKISNIPAINLYKQENFKQIAIRKNYYETEKGKEDAIIMELRLKD